MSYDRRNDPNDGIVSAEMSLWDFLGGLLLSCVLVFLIVGYCAK